MSTMYVRGYLQGSENGRVVTIEGITACISLIESLLSYGSNWSKCSWWLSWNNIGTKFHHDFANRYGISVPLMTWQVLLVEQDELTFHDRERSSLVLNLVRIIYIIQFCIVILFLISPFGSSCNFFLFYIRSITRNYFHYPSKTTYLV